jgi:hypothetical protein
VRTVSEIDKHQTKFSCATDLTQPLLEDLSVQLNQGETEPYCRLLDQYISRPWITFETILDYAALYPKAILNGPPRATSIRQAPTYERMREQVQTSGIDVREAELGAETFSECNGWQIAINERLGAEEKVMALLRELCTETTRRLDDQNRRRDIPEFEASSVRYVVFAVLGLDEDGSPACALPAQWLAPDSLRASLSRIATAAQRVLTVIGPLPTR